MVEHPLAGIGAAPVSDGEPCGSAVRYDADFEALEAEVTKQESLTPEPVDWPTVNRLAGDILRTKSKDLLVAAYLCRGLMETDGYTGLAAGMQVIHDLLDGYWDGMFPPLKRARARSTAMQWLAERAGQIVAAHQPAETDAAAVLEAEKLLRAVDGILVEKMGDDAPNLMELSRPLRDLKRAAEAQQQAAQQKAEAAAAPPPEPAPAPATAEPAPAETAAVPAAAPAEPPPAAPAAQPAPAPAKSAASTAPAPAAVESDADVRKVLRAVQDSLRKTAAFALQARATDARAYRLNRIATWLMIDQLPPNQDGVTQLVAVPEARRKQLQQMFDQAQFSVLVPELEQTLGRASFWLDGQRMAAAALQGMGGEAAEARGVVIQEMAGLVSRLPGLVDLKFSDGTPFADDQTRMWLETDVLAAGGEGGGGEATPWTEAATEARSTLVGGDAGAAFALFERGINGAASERERFHWRLNLAELLVQAGRAEVAVPVLDAAAARIDEFRLEAWEPGLAAEAHRLMYVACNRLRGKGADAQPKSAAAKTPAPKDSKPTDSDPTRDAELAGKAQRAYANLCRLDPVRAISLKEE